MRFACNAFPRWWLFILAIVAPGALTSTLYSQVVRYVRAGAPAGGDGATWATAYPDLETCLQAQPSNGEWRVNVAQGTHFPRYEVGDTDPSFTLHSNVYIKIYGGYKGDALSGPGERDPTLWPTVLSGNVQTLDAPGCGSSTASCFLADPNFGVGCEDYACCAVVCGIDPNCCESVWDQDCADEAALLCDPEVDLTADSVVEVQGAGLDRRIDGVTIEHGGDTVLYDYDRGGGVSIATAGTAAQNAAVELVRCIVRRNKAYQGGGIHADADGNCGSGAKIRLRVWNCQIVDNVARTFGGGMFAVDRVEYEIVNTVIARNGPYEPPGGHLQSFYGGGLCEQVSMPGVPRQVVNCTITRNRGLSPGIAQGFGAPAQCFGQYDSDLLVVNSIVRGNLQWDRIAELWVDCVEADLPECDLEVDGGAVVRNCNIHFVDGDPPPGAIDCIDVDPLWVNADIDQDELDTPSGESDDDYHLQDMSLCIDAGISDPLIVPQLQGDPLDVDDDGLTNDGPKDLDLSHRIQPSPECAGDVPPCPPAPDLGAYEVVNCLCNTADLNGDGGVDGADLGILLTQWGGAGSADFNEDGVVDGADLGVLLAGWCDVLPYPRNCPGESMMAGALVEADENIVGTDGLSAQDLAALLGFGTVADLVDWLDQLPFKEMQFWLDLLG